MAYVETTGFGGVSSIGPGLTWEHVLPSIDRLIELLRIVDAGSITGAAEALHMERATLSRRISSLEDELGVQLLHRSPRSLRLTYAGEVLVASARRIDGEAEDAWRSIELLQDSVVGPLRVSTPPTELFSDLLVGFAAEHPGVRVLVMATPRHVDLVTENVDVALRFGTVSDEGLVARHVSTIRTGLVAAPAYLEEHGTPARPEDLHQHRCILGHGQSGMPGQRWALRSGGTVRVQPQFASEGLVPALMASLRGIGIALLPEHLTEPYRASGQLRSVLDEAVGTDLVCQVVFAERRNLLRPVRAFIDYTVAHFARGRTDFTALPPIDEPP